MLPRFLKSIWRLVKKHVDIGLPSSKKDHHNLTKELQTIRRQIHETIEKVTDDIDRRYKFNTAIAAVMELVNGLSRMKVDGDISQQVRQEGLEVTTLLLTPITPHITEVLWRALGHNEDIAGAAWPSVDKSALIKNETTVVVQINGKKRASMILPVNSDKEEYESRAFKDPNVMKYLTENSIVKVIVIPNKLINIVLKPK